MAKKFDKLLEKATDATLVEADWELIMNCADCVRSGEVSPKVALASVRKRYHVNNPHVCHHALLLLEALVKNCGDKFHREVATKECMEDMKHLAAESSEKVKEKILELIQCWAHAFRDKSEYKIVKDTHALMKLEGFTFPAFREADAMFAAEVAPEWVDADTCYRCKSSFSLLNRKHHCRNCGQIFCDKCSSRSIPLPHIGIEKEVRVCETCFDKLLKHKPGDQNTSVTSGSKADEKAALTKDSTGSDRPNSATGKSDELSREEEEFQLALAISQSEAEEKERQRQRALVHMYNGPPAAGQENTGVLNGGLGYKGVMDNSIATTTTAAAATYDQSESELARYLNRDYWEQKRVEQKTGILRQSPTPSAPSSDSSPTLGAGDDAAAPNAANHGYAAGGGEAMENGSGSGVDAAKPVAATDLNFAQFAQSLRSTVDVFINRIRSDQMRGRSILGDGNVQTMFMTLTNMHSQLLKHLNELDDRRGYFESLQDKLAQIQDAREAIEALRDEHEQHRRAELLELQRQRQVQMFAKLGSMRQKKHEMLEHQRLLALQRMEEERRQLEMRKQMQQQASMMARYAATGGGPGLVGPQQQQQQQQPMSYYGGVQQPQQPSQQTYYGPAGGVPVANPYDMHQMAANLPPQQQQVQQQQQQHPPANIQQQHVPNYGPHQYQNFGQAHPQYQAQTAAQVSAASFPAQQQMPPPPQQQQSNFYQSPYHHGQQAAPAQSSQPTATSYYSGSPAHTAPIPSLQQQQQQQQQHPSTYPASAGGYAPSVAVTPGGGGGMPQYVMAPTTPGYDTQHQQVPVPQGVVYQQQPMPMQQQQQIMSQQPIPEAQLICFD